MNFTIFLNETIQSIATLRPAQIELRPGQILQGTIIKQFPDQLATVQLGGLLITARLEAALEDGQKIWLQVQPERNPITLRLIEKPESSNVPSNPSKTPAGPSLNELAKALNVSLNKEQVSFLQTLVEQNVPINIDLLRNLPNMVKQFGATQELARALDVMNKKELPLTDDTISAVQAFQKNEGYANQIERILQKLAAYAQQNPDQQSVKSPANDSMIQNLTQQLLKNKEIIQTLDQYLQNLFKTDPDSPVSKQTENAAKDNFALNTNLDSADDAVLDHDPNVISANQHDLNNAAPTLNQVSKTHAKTQAPAVLQAGQWITDLFQQLGLQHEHQISQSSTPGQPETVQHLANLKAAILQLLQSPNADSLPQTLKQDLGQLAEHITGQQLMVTDSNAATAFVQFSIQIPLPGLQQDQNAFIHIESRKKGKKAIDQENCRLFFYLTMQHLGETALDVSIVNKTLSVTFYNDQSWVPNLVQPLRGDLENHLLEQGYMLSNFKIMALPEKAQSFIQSPPDSMKNYKGVDLRI